MSRRKQSNPKPLKRKADEELEELAEVLRLPTDVLEIRESQHPNLDYTVCSHVSIREGTIFGPYSGHVVSIEDTTLKTNTLEAHDKDGRKVRVMPKEDSCPWLRLVGSAGSPTEANLSVLMDGEEIWCTVCCDIPPDTELRAWCTVRQDSVGRYPKSTCNGPVSCLPSSPTYYTTSPEAEERTLNKASGEEEIHKTPSPRNEDNHSAKERLSPNSTATSPGSSLEMPQSEHYSDSNLHYTGGTSNNLSAFPFRLTSTLPAGGHFIYVPFVPQVGGSRTPGSDNNGEKQKMESQHIDVVTAEPSDNLVKDDKDALMMTLATTATKNEREQETARSEKPETKYHKSSRQYLCRYCNYTADKKANLTRHMRIHGSPSLNSECHMNDANLRTPPIARYCSNCEIQFSSYKNYNVHKQYYCNTRHVQKTAQPVASQGSSSQADQPVTQVPTGNYQSGVLQTQEKNTSPSQTPNPYNLVLNQPVYAAISTNPLILVPCSYIAGDSVAAASGLIPAGNIIIPSGTAGHHDNGTGSSVIPAFTVMPSGQDSKRLVRESIENRTTNSKRVDSEPKICPQEGSPHTIQPDRGTDTGEKPLDLSLRKHDVTPNVTDYDDCECTKSSVSSVHDHMESKPNITVTNLQMSPLSSVVPTGQVIVPPTLAAAVNTIPTVANEAVPQLSSQVLVKQGTSKCKECNIVFYKYENYLVHKKHYCSARKLSTNESSSPDHKLKDDALSPVSDVDRKDDDGTVPVSRNKRPRSSTPGETSDSRNHSPPLSQPMYQFYCMACGIKFTSLDNLQAHQTFYCPKRDALRGQQLGLSTGSQRQHEFKCSRCKNSYPTEEALKGHPCMVQRKCPYCDVFCPTLSAAQRHLATHTGVKAFRCTICGYKGHTLRGMRTHIRIHLDKGRSTPEESYIVCVDEEGSTIGSPSSRRSSTDRHAQENVPIPEIPRCDSASSNVSAPSGTGPPVDYSSDSNGKKSSSHEKSPEQSGEITHWCQMCGYSSCYKGNVVRHVKLVHRERVTTQQVQSTINNRQSEGSDSKRSSPIPTKPDPDSFENGLSGGEEMAEVASSVGSDGANANRSVIVSPQEKSSTTTDPVSKVPGSKYCKACDISFNYLSNFLAHKKFYCTPRTEDVASQEPAQVQ